MSDIKGPPADLTFTLTVTRKDTGEQEHYKMEGRIIHDIPEAPQPKPEGEAECPQP